MRKIQAQRINHSRVREARQEIKDEFKDDPDLGVLLKNFNKNYIRNFRLYDLMIDGEWYTPKMLEFWDDYEKESYTVKYESMLYRTASYTLNLWRKNEQI